MATSVVLLAESFKSITCFWRAFHMKGALSDMADDFQPSCQKIIADFLVRSTEYGRAGFVGLSKKALTRDATRRLRYDVLAAGWLHSIVLHVQLLYIA